MYSTRHVGYPEDLPGVNPCIRQAVYYLELPGSYVITLANQIEGISSLDGVSSRLGGAGREKQGEKEGEHQTGKKAFFSFPNGHPLLYCWIATASLDIIIQVDPGAVIKK